MALTKKPVTPHCDETSTTYTKNAARPGNRRHAPGSEKKRTDFLLGTCISSAIPPSRGATNQTLIPITRLPVGSVRSRRESVQRKIHRHRHRKEERQGKKNLKKRKVKEVANSTIGRHSWKPVETLERSRERSERRAQSRLLST